jgi:DNA-binding GntR family transcriptional regulator
MARGTQPTTSILDSALGEPQDRRTIAEHVAARLRKLILDGTLPPGTALRVNPLAERLGHSSMPVRDALRLLEIEHLVDNTPRRGAIVSALSEDDIDEIYAMRASLEGISARRATERLTDGQMAELCRLFNQMEDAAAKDDLQAFGQADRAFHDHLYNCSGRPRVVRTVSELVARSQRYAAFGWTHRGWRPLSDALDEHRRIYEAVSARDGRLAQQLVRDHLDRAGERLLASVRGAGSLEPKQGQASSEVHA